MGAVVTIITWPERGATEALSGYRRRLRLWRASQGWKRDFYQVEMHDDPDAIDDVQVEGAA